MRRTLRRRLLVKKPTAAGRSRSKGVVLRRRLKMMMGRRKKRKMTGTVAGRRMRLRSLRMSCPSMSCLKLHLRVKLL